MSFKAKWTKALRGGKFKQARGVLLNRANQSHCCLGVGCVVLGLKPDKLGGFPDDSAKDVWDGDTLPTPKQLKRMGLTRRQASKLAELNDGYKTFDEIADHIDRYYR